MGQTSKSPDDTPSLIPPAWTTPVLHVYGHLAKLTQGTSGAMGEVVGMRPCL